MTAHVVVSALRVNVSDLARGEVNAEEPAKRFAHDKVVVQAVTGARRFVFHRLSAMSEKMFDAPVPVRPIWRT